MIKRVFLLLALVTLTACTSLIFQPLRPHFMTPDAVGILYEDITLGVPGDVQLHGWKLYADNNVNGSVLYFHGNAENISTHFANVHWLTEQGFDVYLFDYRGYGKSGGVPQLDAVVLDVESMIGYTIKQIPVKEKLIIIGHSLGGSLAIYGVAHSQYRERIKLLVSVEAFGDYQDVTQDVLSTNWLTWLFQWPFSFTVDNSYRPLDAVANVAPVPLLIMHSKSDQIVPFYHAEALYAAAGEPRHLEIINGDHINIFNTSENRNLLLKYLENYR